MITSNSPRPLFFVLLHAILLSLTQSSTLASQNGISLIEETCKQTINYKLCVSTLESNPESLKADLKGLARISLQADLSMSTKTFNIVKDSFGKTHDPIMYRYFGTCLEEYGSATEEDLPEAIHALDSGNYGAARKGAENTATHSQVCENQFSVRPISRENKLVNDLSLVASKIISMLRP